MWYMPSKHFFEPKIVKEEKNTQWVQRTVYIYFLKYLLISIVNYSITTVKKSNLECVSTMGFFFFFWFVRAEIEKESILWIVWVGLK